MSDYIGTDGTFINSIIGEGTRFDGNLTLSGLLRIDGDFSGKISTSGKVLIGKNGRGLCTVHANTIVIGGVIKGDIHATEKVIILSTGMVIGNITAPKLVAEDGVVLHGAFCILSDQSKRTSPDAIPEPVFNPFS